MIRVVGDLNEKNPTHLDTNEALQALDVAFEWIDTDRVRGRWADIQGSSGIFVAPASPYRDMEAVLDVIRLARERGLPLVGT